MRKILLPTFVCGSILSLVAAGPLMAADAPAQPEKAAEAAVADRPDMPREPIAIKGSKKTVVFSHAQGHESIECVICHHKVNDKPNFSKCSTSGCHDDLTARKGEKSLYFVMHNKGAELKYQSCVKCHTEVVAEKPDLKKALTGCTQSKCHPGDKKKDGGTEKS